MIGVDAFGNSVSLTRTTDVSGTYAFPDLAPGVYTVTVTAPDGYSFTGQDQDSDDTIDSDVDPVTGSTASITVESADVITDTDAGLYLQASIGDRIWSDFNGDGVQDDNEPGIEGVTLTLTGTDGLGNPVSFTTVTGVGGVYSFDDLAPGTYTVTVDTDTLPASMDPTFDRDGIPDRLDLDSDNDDFTGGANGDGDSIDDAFDAKAFDIPAADYGPVEIRV